MSLSRFLADLVDHGRPTVPLGLFRRGARDPGDEPPALRARLLEIEAIARAGFPGPAPRFDEQLGLESAVTLYRAARLLVERDLDAKAVEGLLGAALLPPEGGADADAIYSVDVIGRYLPDLWRLAVASARDDPLVPALQRIGRDWPLSSVGMTLKGDLDHGPILAHPGLRTVLADRILARGDTTRLSAPGVFDAVDAALGLEAPPAGPVATLLRELRARTELDPSAERSENGRRVTGTPDGTDAQGDGEGT